jgi:hypothetical protein
MPKRGFGLRYSAFFRVSALGFRIWAAGGGYYFPVRPPDPSHSLRILNEAEFLRAKKAARSPERAASSAPTTMKTKSALCS